MDQKKISWLNKKSVNMQSVSDKLSLCIESKHFTNYGKNVQDLEVRLKDLLKLDDDKEVVLVNNGASGLTAIVGTYNRISNRILKFATQSFTFPCSDQTFLQGSIIVDLDDNMGPSLEEIISKKDSIDGIVVTNCFGNCVKIEAYSEFCREHNKILIFDNAASPFTIYQGKNILNYGDASFISFHHTKPIGFGEGGAVICRKEMKEEMMRTICFGYTMTDKYTYCPMSSNYKISEIGAIFIDQWLNNFQNIVDTHFHLIKHFENMSKDMDIELYPTFDDGEPKIMSTIPVLFKNKISVDLFHKEGIEVKKYYYPLDKKCDRSVSLFDRIICFPLHIDMTISDIDRYLDTIRKIN